MTVECWRNQDGPAYIPILIHKLTTWMLLGVSPDHYLMAYLRGRLRGLEIMRDKAAASITEPAQQAGTKTNS